MVLGVASLAACGLLLATALPDARAAGAAALMILFVVAFFSDIFLVGGRTGCARSARSSRSRTCGRGCSRRGGPTVPVVAWAPLAILAAWAIGAAAATWLLTRLRALAPAARSAAGGGQSRAAAMSRSSQAVAVTSGLSSPNS